MANSRAGAAGKPASAPASAPPAKDKLAPAPATQPIRSPQSVFLQPPRTTTDNPWRDLHPARVWPD
jgi:hypothetical protein